MCLFEFIRVEGGVTFMKHLKGGASYKILRTSGLDPGNQIHENSIGHYETATT